MKRMFFAAAILAGLIFGFGCVSAQQSVYNVQTREVTIGGDFNNGVTTDTADKMWIQGSSNVVSGGRALSTTFGSWYSRLDTVVNAGAANDSVRVRVKGYVRSVSFQINALRNGSARCDSTKFYLWGNKALGGSSPALLQTFSMPNAASEQVFQYDVNSGSGNPFTSYTITAVNGNLAAGSSVRWRAWLLIR
jgi:hypothetical protein